MARSRRRGTSRARPPLAVVEGRVPAQQRIAAPTPTRRKPAARRPGLTSTQVTIVGAGAIVVVAALVLLVRSGASVPSGSPGGSYADSSTARAGSVAQGQPAPDFTGTTFDGRKLTLSSLRGKPVLLNFFASWCTSCEHELPAIQREYLAHKDQGFIVLGVNSLENGDGVSFYHRFGVTFPAVRDPGQPGPIASAYQVTNALPASVFIDRSGNVDRVYRGEITSATIEDELNRIG